MEPITSEGMCRCCASEGTFKDFLTAYHWMGEEEIYAEMLKDCFSITLHTAEDINNGGICEVCVTQLRNACNFKRQVQQTEELFKKRVLAGVPKANAIKLEASDVDEGEHSDANLSDDFSADDYEVPIKEEKAEEKTPQKPKKRQAAKASTPRAKKAKTDDGEPSVKREHIIIEIMPEDCLLKQTKSNIKQETKVKKPNTTTGPKKIPPIKSANKSRVKMDDERKLEVKKHRINLSEILLNSNATPIRFRSDLGYACCFCLEQYLDPADLKMHTIEDHDANSIKKVIREMRVYTVKLDITGLNCALCQKDLATIDTLIDHLIKAHERIIYTDIKNYMVPFKFHGDELNCAICSEKFRRFRNLTEHMNTHFRNFVCDACGAGFVNRDILRSHLRIHRLGNFCCDFCSKTFDTLVRKQSHINVVHRKLYMTRKCGYCSELFDDYYKKNEHLAKYHGITRTVLKCDLCDKTYTHQRALRRHIRRDHLKERNHACDLCNMKFFSSENLARHMVKHTGQRNFPCEVCGKSFSRNFTLKQHMKVHIKEQPSPAETGAKYLIIEDTTETESSFATSATS